MTDTFLVVNPTKDGKFEVWFEPAPVAAAGDLPGHPFRGNQWTDAIRSEDVTTGWGPPAQTAVDERFTAAADVKSGWVSGYYRGPDDAFLARHNLDRQSYDQLYHDAFTSSKVRDAEELAANNRWHEVMQDFYQQGGREYPYARDENGEWQSTTRYGAHPWDVPGWVKDDGQVDPARLQESVTNLSAYVRAGELAVQVPAGKLDDILADGRLRSASEVSNHWSTGKDPDSPGDRVTGYATARREVERDYIGVEKGTPRAERPIYGYITGDGSSVYYGNATIYLRDSVRDRASVTAGDSLDGRLIPQSLRSVERGDFDPRLNMKTALVPGQGRYTSDGAAEWTQDAVPPMYVEAQIAGGVRLSDIARIEIRQTADYRETAMTQQVQGADTLDRLRAAGIEVTVSTAPNFGTRTGAVARQDVEPLPAVVAAITHRVLAHRADQLLVDVGDGVGVIEINGTAVTPPTALITLLAQPYWEPVERTGIIAGGRIELGEGPGHPFRGNQHTGGIPADEDPSAPGRQITGYHTTDPESVETILRDGFDPLAPRRYGSLYGKGIYFHLDTPTGRAAQAQMWGERFKATITTHNPFLLDQKEIAKFDVSKGSIKEQIASKLGVLDRFNELKDDKAKTQPFVREDVRAGHALRQAAMEAGYDAIIVRGSHGSDTLAHDQIVVFNADQVKIVGQEEAIYTQPVDLAADDTPRPMVLLSVPAFLMNLENQKRARVSLAVVQLLELGDVEGHPFRGNQWTGGRGGAEDSEAVRRLTPEERQKIVGGLTAADYPYGQLPGQIDKYANYMYTRDLWTDEITRTTSIDGTPRWPRASLEWNRDEEAKARDVLARTVQEQDPTVRVTMASFKQILEDGEIRNQWETGKSGAGTGGSQSYEPIRGNAETTSIGVPLDATPAERPVYGYFAESGRGDFLHADNPKDVETALQSVAPIEEKRAAILADPDEYVFGYVAGRDRYHDVWTREQVAKDLETRFASPDKGDTQYYRDLTERYHFFPLGDGNGNLNTDTVVAIGNREWGANSYGDVQITLKRDILDQTTVTGGDSIDAHLMAAPARLVEAADPRVPIGMVAYSLVDSYDDRRPYRPGYVEAQFARHPQVEDFAHVTFTGSKPSRAMTSKLDALGITWTHDPMLKMRAVTEINYVDIPKWGAES